MESGHPPSARQRVDWPALLIFFSAWCSLAGWSLSAVGCLNRWGYFIAAVLLIAVLVPLRSWLWCRTPSRLFWPRVALSRRWPPRLWLILALLSLAGGLLYHPVNYDYLTYRFPRVLNWCWEQKWYWISPTNNLRLNYSAPGFEWMITPLFVIFQTDRLFFLLNFLPYLLLPSLVFSVFRGLGISPRLVWWWMWVLPSGYCFILQAASAGNDAVAAVYLLASFHYIFTAEKSTGLKNQVLSCLAIALVTGNKASNLPLVLPWLIAAGFSHRAFLTPGRPVVLAGAVLGAAAASFLPMALLNFHHSGEFFGDPQNIGRLKLTHPIAGIIGNGLQMASGNLAPPLWSRTVFLENELPAPILQVLWEDFPRFYFGFGEMQIEEEAGVGIGVTVFVLMLLALGCRAKITRSGRLIRRQGHVIWIVTGATVALLVYMTKMGSEATARLLAAYYPMLLGGVSVVANLDGLIVKRLLFKTVGTLSILSALPLVILSPARPLFPAAYVSHQLESWGVNASARTRFDQVYSVYAVRFDGFHDLRIFIPKDERTVGFVSGIDDASVSLWLPFGSRRVIQLIPEQSRDDLKALGIRDVIVSESYLKETKHMTLDELQANWSADLVKRTNLVIKVHRGADPWCLIRCR